MVVDFGVLPGFVGSNSALSRPTRARYGEHACRWSRRWSPVRPESDSRNRNRYEHLRQLLGVVALGEGPSALQILGCVVVLGARTSRPLAASDEPGEPSNESVSRPLRIIYALPCVV